MLKKGMLLVIMFLLGLVLGVYFVPGKLDGVFSGSQEAQKQPLYWVAPMDKNYRRDGPGKSPMGMDLVPVYEEEQGGDMGIRISPVVENNLGVKTAKVIREQLVLPINTVGTVNFDESRIQHIHTRVEGWIESLSVAAVGDRVKQGQVLFELYSPALVSAQEEYLAAVRSNNTRLSKSSAGRLYALGLTKEQVSQLRRRGSVKQTVSILASRSGVVTNLMVRKGMFIKPSIEVMAISDLSSVWVIGEVFERQAGLVKEGLDVVVSSNSFPGRAWNGQINYVYPEVDPATRTLKVRVRLDNADELLRSEMLVDLMINSSVSDSVLTIPRSAVIKSGQHKRVVKALGDGRYQSIPVKTGFEGRSTHSDIAIVEVLDGLAEGDLVVNSAQFLIDSESYVEAEFLRMVELTESGSSQPTTTSVLTKGVVEKVMADMGMVTITHEPIPEWDWPTMKMDFVLAEGVPATSFTSGEGVDFLLEKRGDWDYLIIAVGENAIKSGSKASDQLPAGAVRTKGEVRDLMLEMNMIQVVHEPIPEWDWPEMNMSFVVKEGAPLPALEAGDRIAFVLRETKDGDYEISEVEKQ